MYIITIAPIARGILSKELSYFTKNNIDVGNIVTVPIRGKKIHGIVIAKKSAKMNKLDVKNLPYKLKRADKLKTKKFFSENFLRSVEETAEYHLGTIGQVIEALTPKIILENVEKLPAYKENKIINKKIQDGIFVIQGPYDEREIFYKSTIREEFAKGNSVFLCLPTVSGIEYISKKLSYGIEKYTKVLHNSLPKKKIISIWKDILEEDHPLLIIATGSYMSIPKGDIKTFILEKENSPAYKNQRRPYIDLRFFAEHMAKNVKGKVIFGDTVLRTETLYKEKGGIYIKLNPFKFRLEKKANIQVVDMNKYKSPSKFKIISDELDKLIKDSIGKNEKTILVINRKGLSQQTICNDCGKIVLCDKCDTPLVLHNIKRVGVRSEEKIYMCHKCTKQKNVEDKCKNCGGFRLKPLGIGIDKAEEEIRLHYPKINIFRLDGDIIKNTKNGKEIIEKFAKDDSSILISTEILMNYLRSPVDNIGVISIDPIFSIPDYRISERVINTLFSLSGYASKNFIVQTRNVDEEIFNYLREESLIDFYKNEIEERKNLSFPPFSVLIKISRHGNYERILDDIKKLAELLSSYNPEIFPGFTSKIKGKYNIHLLMKINTKNWPDRKLADILESLPPSYSININPESILN